MINNMSLEFGTGDIGVSSGIKPFTGVGFIGFTNQEPKEIGFIEYLDKTVFTEDFPLIMHFTKTKSIDVVISALEEVKRLMTDYEADQWKV